jgi:hypothetical protein
MIWKYEVVDYSYHGNSWNRFRKMMKSHIVFISNDLKQVLFENKFINLPVKQLAK